MGRKALAAGLTCCALLAAGCSGSGQAAPLTAAQIALKVPGCHKPFTPSGGVSVQAATEQECLTPDAEVFAATFTSAALQRQWITAQQASGCGSIEGNLWAVTVLPTVTDAGCQVETAVAKALGGRLVAG